jgi:hypothetical protein
MSTSRWNLLPVITFNGLPACAPVQVGLPVIGFVGATHMSAAWAGTAKLADSRRANRNVKKWKRKNLARCDG